MLFKSEVAIAPEDTYASLQDKLARAGADLIVPALAAVEKGEVKPEHQNASDSSYVGMIDKSMGQIDFARPAAETARLIRGLNPWPSAYTSYKGKKLKIWEVSPCEEQAEGDVYKRQLPDSGKHLGCAHPDQLGKQDGNDIA